MKVFINWFKLKLSQLLDHGLSNASQAPASDYNEGFYNNYFSLIASGARLKLVEAMFRLNLFTLFENKNYVLEREIIDKLGLVPLRARKWLNLLCGEQFLIKVKRENEVAYQLPERFLSLYRSQNWWALQFFYNLWTQTAAKDLTQALTDPSPNSSWSWPPKTIEQAKFLENWMTKTVQITIDSVLDQFDFKKIRSVLDVGGGDGTLACALVSSYPHLQARVYNLPYSAQLARENIASRQLEERVRVHEGDFNLDEAFPVGHDLVLFARVLMDWGRNTCRKLLRMAYQSLAPGGYVLICEIFLDQHHDTCLACEYGYIFHDDMDSHVMKTAAEYRQLLKEAGFTVVQARQTTKAFCTLIVARKLP